MHKRLIATAVAALAAIAAAAALAVPASALTAQIDLTVKDSSCQLALASSKVPFSAVLFHLINNGTVSHGMVIWGVRSHMFKPQSEGDLLVNFHRAGTYHYACTTGSYLHPKTYGGGVFKIVN